MITRFNRVCKTSDRGHVVGWSFCYSLWQDLLLTLIVATLEGAILAGATLAIALLTGGSGAVPLWASLALTLPWALITWRATRVFEFHTFDARSGELELHQIETPLNGVIQTSLSVALPVIVYTLITI